MVIGLLTRAPAWIAEWQLGHSRIKSFSVTVRTPASETGTTWCASIISTPNLAPGAIRQYLQKTNPRTSLSVDNALSCRTIRELRSTFLCKARCSRPSFPFGSGNTGRNSLIALLSGLRKADAKTGVTASNHTLLSAPPTSNELEGNGTSSLHAIAPGNSSRPIFGNPGMPPTQRAMRLKNARVGLPFESTYS